MQRKVWYILDPKKSTFTNPTKTGGEVGCSWRVRNFCSMCDICRATVKGHEHHLIWKSCWIKILEKHIIFIELFLSCLLSWVNCITTRSCASCSDIVYATDSIWYKQLYQIQYAYTSRYGCVTPLSAFVHVHRGNIFN